MDVCIEMIGRCESLCDILRDDGWDVDVEMDENLRVYARHPRVVDRGAALERLRQLGLLTSGTVRIDFRDQTDA